MAKLQWKGWSSASEAWPYRVEFDGIVHKGDGASSGGLPVGSEKWKARDIRNSTPIGRFSTREKAKEACQKDEDYWS